MIFIDPLIGGYDNDLILTKRKHTQVGCKYQNKPVLRVCVGLQPIEFIQSYDNSIFEIEVASGAADSCTCLRLE